VTGTEPYSSSPTTRRKCGTWRTPPWNDGAFVQLFGLHRGANQRWRLEQVELFEAFQIRSLASNLVLDIPGFSQNEGGVEAQQFASNGGFNQLWQRVPTGGGTEKLRCVSSGKVLDYVLQAAINRQPGDVGQYSDNGGQNQEWRIV
jgi:hypothetical protein